MWKVCTYRQLSLFVTNEFIESNILSILVAREVIRLAVYCL